jgi:large subunit ribosomal protein L2
MTPGNCTTLKNLPLSAQVHNIELNLGAGGQLVRGAGSYGTIMAKEGKYVNIKLPSGEVKKLLEDCLASIGVLSNTDFRNRVLGKAGIGRHLGMRPHIRGVAIANPTDHPHGGSYRDKGIGRPSPVSPWGWKTRGKKTRSRKIGQKYLVSSRKAK